MNITKYIATFAAAGVLLISAPAFAQGAYVVGSSVNVSAVVGSTTISAKAQARITDAKSRADQEITRRITALTDVNTRVQAMVRVSATEKAAIATEAQNEISTLTTLKATIDGETTLANLKTDIQSITKDYRIFMLIIPQGRIEVAADKIQTLTSTYTTFASTLQTRITAGQAAGKYVTGVNASLSDMNAKIADANTQAQAAVTLVANLQPDQGNATVAASNETTLKSARADIKAALADLKAARQDAGSIVKTIESWHLNVAASSTTSTQ